MQIKKHLLMGLWLLALGACSLRPEKDEKACPTEQTSNERKAVAASVQALLSEGFETGAKTAYATADVALSTGTWTLNDALLGNTASDRKTGAQSARVRNSGRLTMKFDKTGGAGTVTISHGRYGTDASGSWQLWYSTNSGTSYTLSGGTISTTTSTLSSATFTLNVSGSVRIEIRKTDGGTNRLNFDNISITDYAGSNPVPTLSAMSPTSATAGATATTLTLTGTNFMAGSQVTWNATSLSTTYVSTTQLSASMPATLLASAGTASVSVTNPAPGGGTTAALTFTINTASATGKKFLFDNTKAEMAGNADWVLDQDGGVPARFPTPAQSGITATTSETYWQGAISAWGVALVKLGHSVETLPSNGSITYGNSSNAQDLSNYHVFVIDEPNRSFSASEKTAILQFVQNGGGLFMVSNHHGSDRDNDGWDGVRSLNDLFSNNTVQTNPFGWTIDQNSLSGLTTYVSTTTHPITHGISGSVTQVEFNSGASITINTTANPNVQAHVWRSGFTKNSNNVLCASSTFGTGRAFLLGDSSPPDDGTGGPGNTLYNGWGVYSHSRLMLNASLWLAKVQ